MISLKKKLLIAGAVKPAPPFSLSGSWEGGNDNWTPSGVARTTTNPRTGSWAMASTAGTGGGSLSYTFAKGATYGLNLTVAFWAANNRNTTGGVAISYSVNGGALVTVTTTSGVTTTYTNFSQTFKPTAGRNDTLTIFLSLPTGPSNTFPTIDDWSLVGAKA